MITKEFIVSNCNKCPLNNHERVIGESNTNVLSDTDILFLAEAPALEEITEDRPLVGRAGKIFRKAFETSNINKYNYIITNIVLCSNIINGKTFNPPEEAVANCKPYWETLVKLSNPKLIFIMGNMAKDIFGINGKITEIRGNTFKYNTYDVFLTLHPSYILRNGGENSDKFKIFFNDFIKAKEILENKCKI